MRRICTLMAAALQLAMLCASAVAVEPLAARYETTFAGKDAPAVEQPAWYFVRTPERITTASGERAEIWERAANGSIWLQRAFREHRFVVEYAPAELAARGSKPDWEGLGAIVSAAVREALKQTDETREVFGKTAQILRGQRNGEDVEVWWLGKEGIPALLKRGNARGVLTMRLAELRENAAADWPIAAYEQTREYRWVDAADLGDMEHDPAIKRLLREDGIGDSHLAHEHPR
jgi:hypothetical protein